MAADTPETRWIKRLYFDQGAHGKDHALKTLDLVSQISSEPEYQGIIDSKDRSILRMAALVHDAGYPLQKPYWSGTQWEHTQESVGLLDQVINGGDDLTDHDVFIARMLVLNHDNTSFSFPAYKRLEMPRKMIAEDWAEPELPPGALSELSNPNNQDLDQLLEQTSPDKFFAMFQILIEADARLGSPQRTFDFSMSRGIPAVVDDGGVPGIGLPAWQYTSCANVLLAARRAILDAYTKNGQQLAWQLFEKSRNFINQAVVKEMEKDRADDDLIGPLLRREDVEGLIWNSKPIDRLMPYVRITRAFPIDPPPMIIGEGGIKKISSRLVNIDEINHRTYKGKIGSSFFDHLTLLNFLRECLIKNYAHDPIIAPSGILQVETDRDGPSLSSCFFSKVELTLVPPELQDKGGGRYDLVSGFEWFYLAKDLGFSQIRVILVDS